MQKKKTYSPTSKLTVDLPNPIFEMFSSLARVKAKTENKSVDAVVVELLTEWTLKGHTDCFGDESFTQQELSQRQKEDKHLESYHLRPK